MTDRVECARCGGPIEPRPKYVRVRKPRRGHGYWIPATLEDGQWCLTGTGWRLMRVERIPEDSPIPQGEWFRRTVMEPRELDGEQFHHRCLLDELAARKRRAERKAA